MAASRLRQPTRDRSSIYVFTLISLISLVTCSQLDAQQAPNGNPGEATSSDSDEVDNLKSTEHSAINPAELRSSAAGDESTKSNDAAAAQTREHHTAVIVEDVRSHAESVTEDSQQHTRMFDHHEERVIVGHCSINKPCREGEYCDYSNCYRCKLHGVHCEATGQCCKGAECQYGICEKGIYAGEPGTFCDRRSDCKGADTCCILEHGVSEHNAICKPMLNEHEMCGPINLFQQYTRDKASEEAICGPCKEGLVCESVSPHGRLSVCLNEKEV